MAVKDLLIDGGNVGMLVKEGEGLSDAEKLAVAVPYPLAVRLQLSTLVKVKVNVMERKLEREKVGLREVEKVGVGLQVVAKWAKCAP